MDVTADVDTRRLPTQGQILKCADGGNRMAIDTQWEQVDGE